MKSVNKSQSKFMVITIGLFLGIIGRINFLQLSRYSKYGEQYFRNQFEKDFDYMELNKILIQSNCSNVLAIAFDPCYISKSGKKTPQVGWYWSGVANTTKWGLEIGGLAVIDINNHCAFHLEAIQTKQEENISLLTQYANSILKHQQTLTQLSKYILVDAYFSKKTFVSAICDAGFEIISRLRTDAHLQYEFLGIQKQGRGRPKTFNGKVDYNNLDLSYFKEISISPNEKIYQAKLYSKALKKWINSVLVYSYKKGKWTHKNYFSTDLDLNATTILEYYKSRFQIEFLYRDAKQNTSLNHCQARSEKKLHSHFNLALTAVNIAKITYWIPLKKEERLRFSMRDIKTSYSNELHLNRFIRGFRICPNTKKNKAIIKLLKGFGKIAT
ncbi:transposase [Lutibacter sp.]